MTNVRSHVSSVEDAAQHRDRVLVIEDDFDIQQSLAQILQEEGYDVDCAFDGAEGLAKLRANDVKPSVIILDLWMPRMNGFGFRSAQLASPDTADIPVVVVTAGGVAPNEKAILGLAYVMHKPVDLDILLRVVRRLASTGHGHRPHAHAGLH
jgi:DNA-binding response OmpR family regulator